jgi:hypothetical protein
MGLSIVDTLSEVYAFRHGLRVFYDDPEIVEAAAGQANLEVDEQTVQ